MALDMKALASIPTIPAVAMRLLNVISNPDAPVSKIVETVKADPGITAKMLKAANSPMYGGRKIDSLDRAVVWLGRHAVSCLALSFSLADNASRGGVLDKYYQQCWLQSVIQGLTMELLAERFDKGLKESAFVTGLLMDVGRLALLQAYPSEYVPLLEKFREEQRPLREVEIEAFEQSHVEISAHLLTQWSLPDSMVEVVKLHELTTEQVQELADHPDFRLILMANTAAACSDFLFGIDPAGSLNRLETLTRDYYKFDDGKLDAFLDDVRRRLDETSEMFATDISCLPTSSELLACAMEQLAQLSLRSHMQSQNMNRRSTDLAKENEDLKQKVNDLEKRSCIDNLTQAYTREYFNSRLQQRIRQLNELQTLGVLFADVDKFKSINDTYGHLTGDDVLRHMGALLTENVRDDDVVARFGGEEFVILVDNPDVAQLKGMAERIRRRVESTVVESGEHSLNITISIGGVLYHPDSNRNAGDVRETLLAVADEAMYECKRAGRNRTEIKELTCGGIASSTEAEAALA